MPSLSSLESFLPKPLEGKAYLGQQFERILRKKAQLYDKEVKGELEDITGDEFAEANRNIAILKNALRDFIKLPSFPEVDRAIITHLLRELEEADPLSERMNYYGTEKMEKKNMYALDHNKNFRQYKASLMDLLKSLENVLPENMYKELISKNNVFAGLLKWVNRDQPLILEKP